MAATKPQDEEVYTVVWTVVVIKKKMYLVTAPRIMNTAGVSHFFV